MARSVLLKFLALLVAAALLLTALASGAAIVGLAASGLYGSTPDELEQQMLEGRLDYLARRILQRYLAKKLGNCPETYLDMNYDQELSYPYDDFYYDKWFYVISDAKGQMLTYKPGNFADPEALCRELILYSEYPMVLESKRYTTDGNKIYPETSMEATMPSVYYGEEGWFHYHDENGEERAVRIGWTQSEQAYTVAVYLLPGGYRDQTNELWALLCDLWFCRFELIGLCAVSLLLLVLVLIYLCCVAAKKPKSEEIRPGGLNRLPLDLYAAAVTFTIVFFIWVGFELVDWNMDWFDPLWLLWLLLGAMGYTGCLLVVCFLFTCAAQFKTSGGFWYKHTFIGFCLRLTWKICSKIFSLTARVCRWLWAELPPVMNFVKALCVAVFSWFVRLVKKCFALGKRFFAFLWHCLSRAAALLPLTWQWLLTAFFLIFVMMLVVRARSSAAIMLGFLVILGIVLYGTYCFGTLLESTKRMSKGDLETKVEDKLLLGSFQEYATHLNALADVAVEAAKKQMKSERMKAELVTNVSHDIKTPLTSIINYVDLLQKAETPEESAQYLEVLDRQSQQLKKLIDDLMEMSKAATGNMAVDLSAMDPVEAVNQALGEFSDKLAAAELTPIFQAPETALRIMADGRLTWRVLSNLLSNAVKYALPGTRLYIDITQRDNKVQISLKNISREQLNVSSEELMERFVRGDASRNTEGSGLGLNIARNLMELQKGQLQLVVDGDLFKATLLFPEA